jgi:hypothetical protein
MALAAGDPVGRIDPSGCDDLAEEVVSLAFHEQETVTFARNIGVCIASAFQGEAEASDAPVAGSDVTKDDSSMVRIWRSVEAKHSEIYLGRYWEEK